MTYKGILFLNTLINVITKVMIENTRDILYNKNVKFHFDGNPNANK